jgi:hypothetical protein
MSSLHSTAISGTIPAPLECRVAALFSVAFSCGCRRWSDADCDKSSPRRAIHVVGSAFLVTAMLSRTRANQELLEIEALPSVRRLTPIWRASFV